MKGTAVSERSHRPTATTGAVTKCADYCCYRLLRRFWRALKPDGPAWQDAVIVHCARGAPRARCGAVDRLGRRGRCNSRRRKASRCRAGDERRRGRTGKRVEAGRGRDVMTVSGTKREVARSALEGLTSPFPLLHFAASRKKSQSARGGDSQLLIWLASPHLLLVQARSRSPLGASERSSRLVAARSRGKAGMQAFSDAEIIISSRDQQKRTPRQQNV